MPRPAPAALGPRPAPRRAAGPLTAHRVALLFAVASAVGCSDASGASAWAAAPPPGFWDHWGDGQAELAGYALTQPRYGELRQGEVVLVFVTEDFDRSRAVKADRKGADTYPVLKLNEARDFQTGVYDYNAMTSVFVPLDQRLSAGVPAKVTFSMQEWCGHVWDQVVTRSDRTDRTLHSYFQSEGEQQHAPDLPADTVYADALPVVVRGLAGRIDGERQVSLVPRLLDLRLHHQPFRTREATLRSSVEVTDKTVPAGTFAVRTVEMEAGGDTTRWWVEDAWPHRLVGWQRSDGEEAALTGVTRMPYWQRNAEDHEAQRAALGLPAQTWAASQPASLSAPQSASQSASQSAPQSAPQPAGAPSAP